MRGSEEVEQQTFIVTPEIDQTLPLIMMTRKRLLDLFVLRIGEPHFRFLERAEILYRQIDGHTVWTIRLEAFEGITK